MIELRTLITNVVKDSLDNLIEDLFALSSDAYLRSVEEARREYREGKVKSFDEVFDIQDTPHTRATRPINSRISMDKFSQSISYWHRLPQNSRLQFLAKILFQHYINIDIQQVTEIVFESEDVKQNHRCFKFDQKIKTTAHKMRS